MRKLSREDAPPGWPEGMPHHSWRRRLVQGLVGVLALAAAFGAGAMLAEGIRPSASAAAHHAGGEAGRKPLYWSCSMHPEVRLPDSSSKCPKCFMDLIPVYDESDADAGVPELTLSERARVLARVQTSPVERRAVTHELRMVGKVAADETRITYISSYIPGRLDRLYVNYTGIFVRKGDHLAEIYSPELLVAHREHLVALDALERARGAPGGAESAVRSAESLVDASRRKLELWGIPEDEIERLSEHGKPSDHVRIDAPSGGWVMERQGYEGMYVETGTRIVTLADLRSVWVLMDAYEMDVGLVRIGQEVSFEAEAYPGHTFSGRVAYIEPVLNEKTRTVRVRVTVPNPDLRLKPDMFVRARLNVALGEGGVVLGEALAGKWVCPMHPEIVKETAGDCDICGMPLEKAESLGFVQSAATADKPLVIPQSAPLLTGTRAVVYVEKQEGDKIVYEGREVRLGQRAGSYYLVSDGLKEGERVVTRGALMIDSAMQIQARPSMMQSGVEAMADAHAHEGQERAADKAEEFVSHAAAGAGYHASMESVVQAYFDLIDQLAASDPAKAAAAVATMRTSLGESQPHGLSGQSAELFNAQVKRLAGALPAGEAPGLATIRESLPAVTAALENYLRTFGHGFSQPVARHYCPMAFNDQGAGWLQPDKEIRNPYFGEVMLRCGEIRGLIARDGSESK